MITVKLALLATNSIIDSRTNAVSLIEIFEAVDTPAFPVLLPQLVAFFLLEREADDPNEMAAELVFTLDHEELYRFSGTINFGETMRTRNMFYFGGYVIPRPGVLRASLHANGAELGSCTVKASQVVPQPEVRAV